jgi:hypothetical protein
MKFDILGLLPPTGATPAQDRWQRAMTGTVITLVGALIMSTASLGAGLYQAATDRADIRENIAKLQNVVKDGFNMVEAGRIAGNIIGMQTRYCDASRRGSTNYNPALAQNLNETIADLQNQYMLLTGLHYPVRSCA